MPLSSCYFCGTAIEEPLSEYPVVPDALGPAPGGQQTVVLCPACHRKLSTITDRVVAAVDDRQRTLDEASAGGPGADASDAHESGDAGADADGSALSESNAVDRPSTDESTAESLLETGPSQRGPDDRSSDEDGIVVTDSSGGTGDGSDPAPESDESAPAESVADPAAGVDGSGATAGGIGEDGPPQATYNRVVRLLQNREFPVERDEIATVAMNAYEIPPEDFDAVIETAVDRGLLVEEGGYLQRAD